MDAPVAQKPAKINRLLPYCAVFQADLHLTLRSWVYRFWLAISVMATAGYLIYRFAVRHEAAIVQYASVLVSDLLRWSVLGSVTIIIVLTGGSISSERGTMADSVLSRGISRYQYFLGKWHARLAVVLGTFLLMGLIAIVGGYFFLSDDLSIVGSMVALIMIAAVLGVVVSCGVSVSAVSNSTVVGIAVLWVVVYGVGISLTFLPSSFPAPDRLLANLPNILRGYYDLDAMTRLVGISLGCSLAAAIVGASYFARRDV
jgi:ABC-type transport system involved in multi-copper enzyme maturation permease subunit